ncbi:MAG: FAD-binding oxidoreductase [Ferruginibacter sp.]
MANFVTNIFASTEKYSIMPINRRKFLKGAVLLPGISMGSSLLFAAPWKSFEQFAKYKRVRPQDAAWPSAVQWDKLNKAVNGSLIKIESPLSACNSATDSKACEQVFSNLKNPYYIGDNPALTQTSGWVDAWRSEPSVYAVAAKNTSDVVAAVNFARTNNLRLVVKGGGHSYQGTSNAADSLLIWTRAMNKIVVQETFVATGCESKQSPQHAVTIEAGALWIQAYNEVTTKNGRFVQGGGCATVGVAGLIQSGGFGSFSKNYGLAAAALLEAEIVTADGSVKVVNACKNPDLFWALKGGGGGSFGVVTSLTLRTRELPEKFGAVFGKIKANNGASFKLLIQQILNLYKTQLFNPHWGESISFYTDNSVNFNLVFQGLNKQQADACWHEFENWVKQKPENYTFEMPLTVIDLPAQHLWDVDFLKKHAPQLIASDDRPEAPAANVYWASNKQEAGQFLYAYHSAWLPQSLLQTNQQSQLADAIFASSRHWTMSLHFNKGLAGANAEEIAAAKNTAMNPAVLDAFALAIIAGEGQPAFTGLAGHEPDLDDARRGASRIDQSMKELLRVAPNAGSYVSESDFFEKNWQQSFWGANYPKLAAVKKKYDPDGLFFVHHGVGSEVWSDDGFTKMS